MGPKKQDFWTKINILKGNHCILRIRGEPFRQKLGMILESKVVQKLNLEKKCFLQVERKGYCKQNERLYKIL